MRNRIPGVSSRIIFDKVTIPSKTLCKKEELLDVVAAGKYEVVLMVGAGNYRPFGGACKRDFM